MEQRSSIRSSSETGPVIQLRNMTLRRREYAKMFVM